MNILNTKITPSQKTNKSIVTPALIYYISDLTSNYNNIFIYISHNLRKLFQISLLSVRKSNISVL